MVLRAVVKPALLGGGECQRMLPRRREKKKERERTEIREEKMFQMENI